MLSIIQRLFGDWQNILIGIPVTLIALVGHEFAHGLVSDKLGDPTPRSQGRLTLNPFAHLDLIGTILMILTGFGWAKPVMVNPRYYKNPKAGMALTAAAGPLANLIMAFAAMLIYAVLIVVNYKFKLGWDRAVGGIGYVLYFFAVRNLCFMVFNFIPIPPLDGAKVLGIIVPNRIYYKILEYERYSMILIMLLSLSGAFSMIIGTGVNFVMDGITALLDNLIRIVI
ncbi:MAG: site-2 protease family protein [Clostridia bacterium]|nr:site-2 protease family protein [Clostridia bacterium]